MDYRWDSTAHTRAGWHCVCKYILRFVWARFGARYASGKKVNLCSIFSVAVALPYGIWCSKKSLQELFNGKKKKVNEYLAHTEQPTETNALIPALSDTVSSSYRLSRDYPLSGVMWSRGAGFNSPGECCWKSPGIILPKQSGAPKCETLGAQITGGCSHMWGFKYKGGNNIIGLEPASVSTEGLLDGCIMHLSEFQ